MVIYYERFDGTVNKPKLVRLIHIHHQLVINSCNNLSGCFNYLKSMIMLIFFTYSSLVGVIVGLKVDMICLLTCKLPKNQRA